MQTLRRLIMTSTTSIDPLVDVQLGVRFVLGQIEKAFVARPTVICTWCD